jgi:transcriptional regulator with XRE-family HTH domain
VAARSPTLRRRELASRLRELRKQAGLTVEEVARELICSPPKISRIETGTRLPSLRDVRDLCRLYRVDDTEQERLMTVAREARQQGWWDKFGDLGINALIGLEIEARQISAHDSSVVPWAFQTEQYARTIIKGFLPHLDHRAVDRRVAARLVRQENLRSPQPPLLWSLIDESALRRAVGGNNVMREQLSKMLEVAATPNVTMQIVPFEVGAHPALDSTFVLLEFDNPIQSPVVFVETLAGNIYIEQDAVIERCREILEHLRECALSPADSFSYIKEIRKGLQELLKYRFGASVSYRRSASDDAGPGPPQPHWLGWCA